MKPALGAGFLLLALAQPATQAPDAARAAWQQVDLPTFAVVDGNQIERLRLPAQPGSFMKLPALIAALATHTISIDTRVDCPGEATIGGTLVRCSHPRMRHALRPAEALALSCNVYFATIGERLPRARLDGVLTALGLPPTPAGVPMSLAATGLKATPVPPVLLLGALGRFVTDPAVVPLPSAARQVVLDGLRGSAVYGTSGAFAMHGVEALAKTGTADATGGGTEGLVVAVWPASAPAHGIVLVAPGASGMNAADLAAGIAARPPAGVAPPANRGAPIAAPRQAGATSARTPAGLTLRVGTPRAGGGYDVKDLPLEDYVARVLAGEAASHSPPAALEALAITARTFAVVNRGRHGRDGFDLCTLTHCQVLREPDSAHRAAAAATAGQILVWHDAPAQVFYTASCGGFTERPSNVWPGADDPPYLKSRRDRACGGEPHWAAEIPVDRLDRALHASGFQGGTLRDVKRDGRTSSGRVARLRLVGLMPDEVSAQDFRTIVGRGLGWHLIKSTNFTVKRTGGGFYFEGYGFGHGIGLCVIGSVGRAEHGDSAKAILAAYFPGLKIRQVSTVSLPALAARATPAPAIASGEVGESAPEGPPQDAIAPPVATAPAAQPRPASPPPPRAASSSFQLVLPSTAEPDRAAIAAIVDRAIVDVTRASGRAAPDGLRIVFHPSSASFQRETGESWWSAARTRGARIDLQPPSVLRDRGTLETTVRHEIAHVVIGPILEGRAAWVKEGAAMHFAGEAPPASLVGPDGFIRRVKCPSDLDLERPVSAALARQAYGLAAACFERALAESRDWTAVR